MNVTCKTEMVELQENGIIRNEQGTIMGLLITHDKFNKLHEKIDKLKHGLSKIANDTSHDKNVICNAYIEHLENARQVLKELDE